MFSSRRPPRYQHPNDFGEALAASPGRHPSGQGVDSAGEGRRREAGFSYEQLKVLALGIVYCSISGYDCTGPELARPGYDRMVQGEVGLMAMHGAAGQAPLKFGVDAVDLFTGMYAAQGVLAASFQRDRIGVGRRIEMAQFQRLCTEVIERPDLAQDPRFATNTLRGSNREALVPVIS